MVCRSVIWDDDRVRYFDHNATSPMCDAARRAWLEAVERFTANPSSPHRPGARAERALEEARESLARILGVRAGELVWTSGATEAANAVFHHVSRTRPGTVWVSAVEHPCVLAAAHRWAGGDVRRIPVHASGVVDLDWIADRLAREQPALVAVMAANNETGVLQPWEQVSDLCRAREIPFLCDAAQWRLPARGLGACDFVIGCAHKFGGPPGVGFLKCPGPMEPLIVGGPQEDGRRAGTENVPGALALAAALRDREAALQAGAAGKGAAMRDAFEARMEACIPGIRIAGREAPRLWNTSALLMPPADCRRRWVVRLDKLGFAVSTGSACSSGKEKPSHVLQAMGLDASGDRMVRVSAGWETTVAEWEELASAIVSVAREFGLDVRGS